MKPPWLLLLFLLCYGAGLSAQEGSVPALDYLRDHQNELGLEASDLAELQVTDDYASPSGIRHVYVRQLLYGTPVFNAQAAVHFRDGEAVHHTSRLEAGLHARTLPTIPLLRAEETFRRAFSPSAARLESADLVYFPLPGSPALRLAWQLTVEEVPAATYSLHLIDAVSGDELYRAPLTLNCVFQTEETDAARAVAGAVSTSRETTAAATSAGDGALYHVFPFGVESPLFGERTLVSEPADSVASPYGWHDTDGIPGPEFTYTRGNNAYAYRDGDKETNRPDSGFVADGGAFLDFDFPFSPREAPGQHVPASLTQLFYLTNMMHDWTYRHGFDEASGNFQQNTYGRGGKGGDALLAEAQDGSGANNANFSTLSDGLPGRLQLYLWSGPRYYLDVTAPARLGGLRRTGSANFGPTLPKTPLAGEVVEGMDAGPDPALGCLPLTNADAVRGKIVLLERGDCAFQEKAYFAEQAGAIAVIICNQGNSVITMGKSGNRNITIPALMIGRDDCAALRAALATGERVNVSLQAREEIDVDGSFDNGIVAHEYGHGVSTRLVGGPQTSTCLLNDEQMGEGWSDFFLLASSPAAAGTRPDGTEARGIGLYSTSGFPGDRGFRTRPYSTDLGINDHTYDDIITAALPHGVGEAWASVLWDLYWAMVDTYGFDEDLIGGTGGNNAAVRLVIEALKYTPCRPGYLDGRDALLIADRLENGGANQCLLWEVFRRRGLGFSATQGDSNRRDDNREAFDPNPACTASLKLAKATDSTTITAGDRLTFTLTLRNDKPTLLTGLEITDALPAGAILDPASVTGADALTLTAGAVAFRLDELAPESIHEITYSVTTDPQLYSTHLFYDGMETDGENAWTVTDQAGGEGWVRTDTLARTGERAWYVSGETPGQDQILQLRDSVVVTGPRPALRFFTRYHTAAAFDGGILELSTNGTDWEGVDSRFLRFGYRGVVDPRGPEALLGRPSFWGDSEGYREVVVDLREYRGQRLFVRWRFLSGRGLSGGGWWIDDVELLSDLRTYDGQAVVTTEEGDRTTATAPDLGVIINSGELASGLDNTPTATLALRVYPNPASEAVQVSIHAVAAGTITANLWTLDGRRVWSRKRAVVAGENLFQLPLGEVPAGNYSLRITGAGGASGTLLTVSR